MAALAKATGLTSGFLSQLERDLTSVSLSSLARICAVLDVRFGDVLDDAPTGAVIRREDAKVWTAVGAHEDVLLSSRDEHRFHLMESRIPPSAGSQDRSGRRRGRRRTERRARRRSGRARRARPRSGRAPVG